MPATAPDDDHWWSGFGDAMQRGLGQRVYALTVYGDRLVAGGEFFREPGNYIASWGGSSWAALRGGVWGRLTCPFAPDCAARVSAAVEYRGHLIVGGFFTYADSVFSVNRYPASNIASWDGSAWRRLGTGLQEYGVSKLVVYNDELIASGDFTVAGGVPVSYFARWNGISWQAMGHPNSSATGFALYDGALIASGRFTQIDGQSMPHIAKWDGTSWSSFGNLPVDEHSPLIVYHDSLVAVVIHPVNGGHYPLVSRWNGTIWEPLGSGIDAHLGSIYAFEVYNDHLIVGGNFELGDGPPPHNIARWDGAHWEFLGTGLSPNPGRGEDGAVTSLAVYDGSLYVGGRFTAAGGKPSWYIARWDDVITAVEIEALEAVTWPSGVRIAWHVATPSMAGIRGFSVERADVYPGPYDRLSAELLPPATDMHFDDPTVVEGRTYWYRVRAVHFSGAETLAGPISATAVEGPATTVLYPPVEPSGGGPVVIRYRLASTTRTQLQIFAPTGRLIRALQPQLIGPGEHIQYWDRRSDTGHDVARGVYLVRLETDRRARTQKLVLRSRP